MAISRKQFKKVSAFFYIATFSFLFISNPLKSDLPQEEISSLSSFVKDLANKKEITTEKIRAEVATLEASSFLGFIKANEQNAPTLYSLIRDLADKMEMPVPPLILIYTGIIPTNDSPRNNDLLSIPSALNRILAEVFFYGQMHPQTQNKIGPFKGIKKGLSVFDFLHIFKTNAFCMSLTQNISLIVIGSNLVNHLSAEELEKIIAHELAHIKHYHSIKKGLAALAIAIATDLIISPYMIDKFDPKPHSKKLNPDTLAYQYFTSSRDEELEKAIGFSNLIILPANRLLSSFLSRLMEKQADLTAARVTKDPIGTARALEKLDETLRKKHKYFMHVQEFFEKYLWFFNSHPNLQTRVKYLEEEAENQRHLQSQKSLNLGAKLPSF